MRDFVHGHSIRMSPVRCLVLALAGLTFGTGTTTAQTTVTIDVFNTDFGDEATGTHIDPVIRIGDTVRWRWVSGIHSTTSVAGSAESWNSGDQFSPATFDHTFTRAGTFSYFCDIHGFDNGNGTAGGMSGQVIVQPVPEPSAVLLAAGLAGGLGYGSRRLRSRYALPR